jgi:molecular chaperone DnaK
MTKLIDRNTTIPTRKSETFSTAEDDQTAVTIRVFQGEREMAADNKLLGQFDLIGLPPAPRGVPQIEVTFDIDANGIVQVSAKDRGTGKEQQIRIQASGGLSQSDIERMVREAEEHAAEDKKRRELVEARNQADAAIYAAEKELQEEGSKLGEADRKPVEDAVAALRQAVSGEDVGQIRQRTDALTQAAMQFAEALRRAAGPGPGESGAGPATGSSGAGDEGVVDAQFEEVGEEQNRRRSQ